MGKIYQANLFYETSSNQTGMVTGKYFGHITLEKKSLPTISADDIQELGRKIRDYDDCLGNIWHITSDSPSVRAILNGGRLEDNVSSTLNRSLTDAEIREVSTSFLKRKKSVIF